MVVWVAVAVAGVVVLVVGFFLVRQLRHAQSGAALSPEGYQEALVLINGRYRPEVLRVQQGVPVRIRFLRKEDNPCSERVVFSAFGIDRRLPAFQETAVEFVPTTTGTFLFTCQWGMYRGRLVVVRTGTGQLTAGRSPSKSQRANIGPRMKGSHRRLADRKSWTEPNSE